MPESATERLNAAVNRLAKWRSVFTGWQLGTRPKGEPESDAVRDHREATLMLRCEVTALIGILVAKGIFTEEEWAEVWADEAEKLSADLARRFPGFKATDVGMEMIPSMLQEHGTMDGWKP